MKAAVLKLLGLLLLLLALIVPIIFTLRFVLAPRIYFSSAMVHAVFPESSLEKYDLDSLNAVTHSIAMLAYSGNVLTPAAKAQSLESVYGKRYTTSHGLLDKTRVLQILRRMMQIAPVEDTVGLIRIGVYGTDGTEAAALANQIARALRTYVSDYPQQIKGVEVQLVMKAEPALEPCSPNGFRTTVISVSSGWGLAISGIMLIWVGGKLQGGKRMGADQPKPPNQSDRLVRSRRSSRHHKKSRDYL